MDVMSWQWSEHNSRSSDIKLWAISCSVLGITETFSDYEETSAAPYRGPSVLFQYSSCNPKPSSAKSLLAISQLFTAIVPTIHSISAMLLQSTNIDAAINLLGRSRRRLCVRMLSTHVEFPGSKRVADDIIFFVCVFSCYLVLVWLLHCSCVFVYL